MNLKPIRIEAPRQLLVEGRTALRFFVALLKHVNPDWLEVREHIQVQDFENVENLRPFLGVLSSETNFHTVVSLGVVRDAEDNPGNAFKSVRDALGVYKLPQPSAPGILVGSKPRVAVYILPDQNTPGMLEDLCMRSLKGNPILPCIDQYFTCVEGATGPSRGAQPKARVHAFLAAQKKPESLLGEAADAGYFPWESTAFDGVKEFLRLL